MVFIFASFYANKLTFDIKMKIALGNMVRSHISRACIKKLRPIFVSDNFLTTFIVITTQQHMYTNTAKCTSVYVQCQSTICICHMYRNLHKIENQVLNRFNNMYIISQGLYKIWNDWIKYYIRTKIYKYASKQQILHWFHTWINE